MPRSCAQSQVRSTGPRELSCSVSAFGSSHRLTERLNKSSLNKVTPTLSWLALPWKRALRPGRAPPKCELSGGEDFGVGRKAKKPKTIVTRDPIYIRNRREIPRLRRPTFRRSGMQQKGSRSEEHTSELQSHSDLV